MRRSILPLLAVLSMAVHCQPINLGGRQVTTLGSARSPRLAWNGTHFGIVLLRDAPQGGAHVDAYLVDAAGQVVRAWPEMQWVDSFFSYADNEFLLSDLVWNAEDRQFAFAYARNGVAWLARLNDQMGSIGYSKLAFGSPIPPAPKLADVSLVWNPVRHHYAVATVAREDPYANRHDDIYLSFVKPDGSFSDPMGTGAGLVMYHTVNCPSNCQRTALAADAQGRYRLAYFKWQAGTGAQPTVGFVDESMGFGLQGAVHEQAVLAPSSGAVIGAGLRLFPDPTANEVLVALSRNAGAIAPPGLWLQVASQGAVQTVLAKGGVHDPDFSLSTFAGTSHAYMVCFGDGQVRCRLTSNTSLNTGDWVTPPAGAAPRKSPNHVIGPNGPVLVWVEGGNVFFGPVP